MMEGIPHHVQLPPSQRVTALDAARAAAMLLLCTAHFVDVYTKPSPTGSPHILLVQIINAICRVATPTFFLVSGILLGYFSQAKLVDFARVRLHLFDRAIFLATIGHVLIAIAWAPRSGFSNALRTGFVTDTVAVCVIGGLLLLPSMKSASTQLGVGALLYLTGWAGWSLWHPDNPVLLLARGIFLGPDDGGQSIFYDPLLPWFGVYVIGMSLGSWLGTFERHNLHSAGRTLAGYAAIVFICVLSLNVFTLALNKFSLAEVPAYLIALGKKYPPGPSYVLLFGSAALLLIGGMLMLVRSHQSNPLCRRLEYLGKNAFPILVAQYFLYYSALFLLVRMVYTPTTAVAIMLYVGSLVGIIWLGRIFDRFRVNRFWTVGLPYLVHRWPGLSRDMNLVSYRFPVLRGSQAALASPPSSLDYQDSRDRLLRH